MDIEAGNYEATFTEEQLLLSSGLYNIAVGISSYEKSIQYIENAAIINISEIGVITLSKSIIRTTGTACY